MAPNDSHANEPAEAPAEAPVETFDLRCREAEWIDDDVATDFHTPAQLSASQRNAGLIELLAADAIARRSFGLTELAGERPVLSCETPRVGIPVAPWDPSAKLDTTAWRLRSQLDAELITPDFTAGRQRQRQRALGRALLVAAGSLSLLFTAAVAEAAGPSQVRVVPAAIVEAPPKLPQEAEAAAAASPDAAPAQPAPDQAAPAGPSPDAASTAAPPMANAGASTNAAPRGPAGTSLSLTGDALWAGLLDERVILTMKNGQSLDGNLVAQSSAALAIARSADAIVVSVPKADVAGVRLHVGPVEPQAQAPVGVGPVAERPIQDGRGLVAAGVSLLIPGSALALTGTVFLGIYPSGLFLSMPMLIPGLLMTGGGAAMLAVGKRKRKRFREAWGLPETSRLQLTPTFGMNRQGGHAGLVLRF
ncbi:hypothetical protein G6O69_20260 [Pseudenhygromyxa sp. WMMC2535]|uniref:hypothetical protein n=1 Tax=Pseudenhygromyxa sp. WMMC2535 TaxID=2712867 RepID=UPI001555E29B|nr:hypothetical protein [Pseudenhygromyxa sp. WMMC2535]NVB40192.1 hypothetical protein [Pseudenhygromyxa sp. WMMC2535]